MTRAIRPTVLMALALATGLGVAACQPTVKVEAPDKPIVIDLNVNIQQEVRVKIEKDVDQALQNQPDLFGGKR